MESESYRLEIVMTKTWQFNQEVAKTFVDHAQKHIPNYDRVINKSVEVCQKLLSKDAAIIDVGCATGETLKRLSHAGYVNLTGVDNSSSMLAHCHADATLICSDQFPNQLFDAVLCNWTLHFMPNKLDYLQQIYNNLLPSGVFIISDKTSLVPTMIEFYHDFKSSAGVSEKDIADKAASVRDIMYINNPQWYLETLSRLGFKNIQIIDASWCFTTFFCVKQPG